MNNSTRGVGERRRWGPSAPGARTASGHPRPSPARQCRPHTRWGCTCERVSLHVVRSCTRSCPEQPLTLPDPLLGDSADPGAPAHREDPTQVPQPGEGGGASCQWGCGDKWPTSDPPPPAVRALQEQRATSRDTASKHARTAAYLPSPPEPPRPQGGAGSTQSPRGNGLTRGQRASRETPAWCLTFTSRNLPSRGVRGRGCLKPLRRQTSPCPLGGGAWFHRHVAWAGWARNQADPGTGSWPRRPQRNHPSDRPEGRQARPLPPSGHELACPSPQGTGCRGTGCVAVALSHAPSGACHRGGCGHQPVDNCRGCMVEWTGGCRGTEGWR